MIKKKERNRIGNNININIYHFNVIKIWLFQAKEKYENECAKQVKIESQIPSVGLRESERLKIKLEKCNHDVNVFEQEYKSACIKLADTTTKWDKGWEMACDVSINIHICTIEQFIKKNHNINYNLFLQKFQEMEEKRIEFIHHSFSIYVNILSTSTNQNQEVS